MKITKQRLKEIIKEEIAAEGKRTDMSMPALSPEDFVGAGIEDFPEPPEEEPTRDRAFDSSLGRYATLMNARKKLNQMSDDQLKDLSMSLDAPMLATLQHILGPKYAPIKEGTVELAEQRLPPNLAPEYLAGLRDLIAKHGREKVAQAYKNAGGTDRVAAPMPAIKKML